MERITNKAFLTSNGLTEQTKAEFAQLFGGDCQNREAIYVPTLTKQPGLNEKPRETERILRSLGFKVRVIRLNELSRKSLPRIEYPDLFFLSGGNIFEIDQRSRELHLGNFVRRSVEAGCVYGASSAGTVFASGEIAWIQYHPQRGANPKRVEISTGYGLIGHLGIWPHDDDSEKKHQGLQQAKLDCPHLIFLLLRDGQAAVFDETGYKIVGNPISPTQNGSFDNQERFRIATNYNPYKELVAV